MKVLIVNLMQIGDLVLTTPVFRAIKTAHPDFFLAAAVNQDFADLVKFNPFIDSLFTVDKRSLKSLASTIRDIRRVRFDLCINLNRSERASAIAALSGANRIVGYSKPGFSLAFDSVCPNLKRVMHQIYSHFKVLDAAGFGNLTIPSPEVFIGDTKLNRPLPDNLVAFNVGASWPSKRWLPFYFASVAVSLIQRGFHVAFLGSKADIPIVDECLAFIPDKRNVLVLTGTLSLLELAAFFDYCRLLITNDSGPMHIAAARNCPAVAIFGSSPTVGFTPWHPRHFVIKATVPCHPCYNHSCPRGDLLCMKSISPQLVLDNANTLLNYGLSLKVRK